MQATLIMTGVFTNGESSDILMELLKTAPGVLGTTEAFTEALQCMNADKEVKRSIVMSTSVLGFIMQLHMIILKVSCLMVSIVICIHVHGTGHHHRSGGRIVYAVTVS